MKKLLLVPILVLLMAGTLAACGSDDGTEEIQISDVWSRATTPTQDAGAVYATFESPVDDKLIKASVPASIAGKTELHETVTSDAESGGEDDSMDSTEGDSMDSMEGEAMEGDAMMGMRPVTSIDLPAGEEVVLEPGGYHIMLEELTGQIKDGDTFPVTLTFEEAGEVQVDATARED